MRCSSTTSPSCRSTAASEISAFELGLLAAAFFVAELVLSPIFGVLSDRYGHHRVMQLGPLFGFVAVIITGLTTDLWVLGGTRVLEGASTAASVPSILGFIAMATAHDEALRGKTSARFEAATIAGLGAGIAVAGPMWNVFGPDRVLPQRGHLRHVAAHLPLRRHGARPRRPRPDPMASRASSGT